MSVKSSGPAPYNALQEAQETAATTQKEAMSGDPVAKKLLAKENQAKHARQDPPGTGTIFGATA